MPVAEWQTILDFNASGDGGGGSGAKYGTLKMLTAPVTIITTTMMHASRILAVLT